MISFSGKTLTVIMYASLFLGLNVFNAQSETDSTSQLTWQTVTSKNAEIHFQSPSHLTQFNDKILFPNPKPKYEKIIETNSKGSKPKGLKSLESEITAKVDAIFERAKDLLEMHGFMNVINIKIFESKMELQDQFDAIYHTKGTPRAWYTHEQLTIYMQLGDLHAGMLAHEIAHAIIDHYLIIPPPHNTAEILARYVDRHLNDEMSVASLTHHEVQNSSEFNPMDQNQIDGYTDIAR